LRTDITRYYAASAALSVCLSLLGDEEKSDGIFVALVQALKSLAYGEEDAAIPLTEFLLAALQASGYGIGLDGCGYCENEIGEKPYFDFAGGHLFGYWTGAAVILARRIAETGRFWRRRGNKLAALR
jgi:recombinational DNA repair protein (RecF pathway)